jgi:hypothetical protein
VGVLHLRGFSSLSVRERRKVWYNREPTHETDPHPLPSAPARELKGTDSGVEEFP